MKKMKRYLLYAVFSILCAAFVFSQIGCGLLLVGTGTGAYFYGRHLEQEDAQTGKTQAPVKK